MHSDTFRPVLFALSASLGFGCSGSDDAKDTEAPDGTEFVKSSLERAPASVAEASIASAGEREFAWSFYRQAATLSENFAFSPHSISVASAMLSAGAAGNTLTEIRAALHFQGEGEAFHQSQNALSRALEMRNREATEDQNAQTLRSSNDFWMLPDLQPTAAFLDTLARYYGVGIHLADFPEDPERYRAAINGKVESDTHGLIPELLPEGVIDVATVFVLTNALYFKSRWSSEFQKHLTAPAPFHLADGTTREVPMMHNVEYFPYLAGDGFVALSLPYDGNDLEMVVLMPDAGTFDAFVQSLDAQAVTNVVGSFTTARLELAMPKFEVRTTLPLAQELEAAGMVDAFRDGVADFSPIAAGVFISAALHQAVIIVDEEGTEAAAATAFVGSLTSAPIDEPLPVTLDQPFVFFIRDRATDAPLFVGHVASP